jgi:hypothetical protein
MGLQDLVVTPIYLILLYALAYWIRPKVTNKDTRKYFIPGLTVKFIGAISLGLIYQFYYGNGDTFTYFHLGSKWIWEAFLVNPLYAFQLIFTVGNEHLPELFQYSSRIYTYGDPASYFVVRVAGFFDLLTGHTYLATALCFSSLSYVGVWGMYVTFCKLYPTLCKYFAFAILFVPSLFFWGSGLMKDTLTIGALGMFFYGMTHLLMYRKNIPTAGIFSMAGFYVLYTVKIYIVICFMPALVFWLFMYYQANIRSVIIRALATPVLLALGVLGAGYATLLVSEEHYRYSLEEVAYTAEQTAKWNYHVSQRDDGSGYTLGDFDFSVASLVRKAPLAILTTMFRPFLWEVRNPVMLLSALENLIVMLLFARSLFMWRSLDFSGGNKLLTLCFSFCILFSFAIGVTTYNFGSLVRYKIPMLPFLTAGLIIINFKTQTKNAALSLHHA